MIVNEYGLLMVIVNGDMGVCVCVSGKHLIDSE